MSITEEQKQEQARLVGIKLSLVSENCVCALEWLHCKRQLGGGKCEKREST